MKFLILMLVTFYWQSFSLVLSPVEGDVYYVKSVISDLDCKPCKNDPFSCIVNGFGSQCINDIHNKSSGADGIIEPVPDFRVGSSQSGTLTDCGTKVGRSPFSTKSYTGLDCSYSTSEIAIHSKVPLVSFWGGFEALMTRNLKAPNRTSLNALPIEC